jgi:hypothetical protein
MISISNKHVYAAYATVNSKSSKKISERSDMRDRLTIIGFVATGMLILLLFLLSLLLKGSARDFLIGEGGLIESASAFGHFLCVTIILYIRWAFIFEAISLCSSANYFFYAERAGPPCEIYNHGNI